MRAQHLSRLSAILFLILLAGCAVQPPVIHEPYYPPTKKKSYSPGPLIRVGLMQDAASVAFTSGSDFVITTLSGEVIAKGKKNSHWRVHADSVVPAVTVYRLVAGSFKDRSKARQEAKKIESYGVKTLIRPLGRSLNIGQKSIIPNRRYRIYLSTQFISREQAESFQERFANQFSTFIVEETKTPARGALMLLNQNSRHASRCNEPVVIKGVKLKIKDVPVGQGYHWEHNAVLEYSGDMHFKISKNGGILVMNKIPLETYIRGVIGSEMSADFPLEALKAQAVAARGKVLGAWGVVHFNDPYDVCATVHCQVYSGISKCCPRTDRAAYETTGIIMWKDNEIVDAIFGGVCGGHTEDVDLAWGGRAYSYLEGRYDGSRRVKIYGDLRKEENARRWIHKKPHAYCNTTRGRVPKTLNYSKKYFRWEKEISQSDLKASVQKYLKRDIGQIVHLKPLERGVSGRIICLKIEGTRDMAIINGELNIRKAMDTYTLWSACFTAEEKDVKEGIPQTFKIQGAGWGHGVGMCQVGAAMVARKGWRYDKILKYYYKGVKLKKHY